MEQGCGQRERQDGGGGSGRITAPPLPPPCAPFRIMGDEVASNSEREWDIEDGGAALRRPAPPPPQLPQLLLQQQEQEQRRSSKLSLRRRPLPQPQQPLPLALPQQQQQQQRLPPQLLQLPPSRLSLGRQPPPPQPQLPLQLLQLPPPKRPAAPQLPQQPPPKRPALSLCSSKGECGFDVRPPPLLQPYASRGAESSDSDDFQTPMPRRAKQRVGSGRPSGAPVSHAAGKSAMPRCCQVAGCTAELDSQWRQRNRICKAHARADYKHIAGDPPLEHRFCQQ